MAKCLTTDCKYAVHTDNKISKFYCCKKCKLNKEHGLLCERQLALTINIKKNKYVVYTDWVSKGVLSETYEFIKKLEESGWKAVPLSQINTINLENCVIYSITYRENNVAFLKKSTNIFIYKIEDLYPFTNQYIKSLAKCDYIVGVYAEIFHKIDNQDIKTKPNLLLPHSAVPEFYNDIIFNKNPIKKIFVSGAMLECYPFRRFIANDPQFSEYIDKLEHPSYKLNELKHNILGKKYYEKLNTYICCFCDSSSYIYILSKVFEITSVGSLLLVDDKIETRLQDYGFFNNQNCITCNKDNLLEKIKWILDDTNREKIDMIRKNGMLITREKHNTDVRVKEFNRFVDSLQAC